MTKPANGAPAFSLADIEAQVMGEATFDFEPLLPDGVTESGVIFKLKSDLAPSVEKRLLELIDQDKKRAQLRAAQSAKSRPGEVIEPTEEQATLGRKLVAARIAGWTLTDEFSEANVLRVLKAWVGLSEQITTKAADLARFTPTSPKA